ncbi:MAG TPA: BTAD domain-containing putative transcriptional regulator [Bacillota bacterium]|nr:BTAD domain-containing putative transcriptional regulator [Bacillota bacterium]
MPEVMVTKLLPPNTDHGIIDRPRLIEILSANPNRKLTVLTAPAGYGKSVLTLQFVKTIPKPLVWYQLDSYDNDPAVFIQYLAAGIGRHFPDFGRETLNLLGQGNITTQIRLLVTSMINNLAERTSAQGLALVIDDYHVITEIIIHQFIQELLAHLPAGIQVVIASRTALPISLSRLKVAGDLLALGMEELRFTNREIGDFLTRRHQNLTEQIIVILENQTGGWPAAMQLLSNSTKPIEITLPYRETQEIYDYLATEVLGRQPEEIQEFLFASAVLETMTPEICDLLLERNDSEQIINRLDKQQLFMIPLTGESKTYRYHHLFREFLLDRLGSKQKPLLRRAGKIAWQKGDLDSAVEYLARAGIDEDLLMILKEACGQAFSRGRWETVYRWLQLLTREQIAHDPWLAFFQAKVEVYCGRLDEAEKWVNQGIDGFVTGKDQTGLTECRLLQARILRGRGRYQDCIALLEQIDPDLTEEQKQRFDLPMEKSLSLILTGRFREAEGLLINALKIAEARNDGYTMAHLLEGLGNAYYLFGDFNKAKQSYDNAHSSSPEHTLPNYYTQDNIALIHLLWGESDYALEIATRSVASKENLRLTESLPSAYFQLGRINMERGDLITAETCFNRGIDLIKENKSEYFYLTLNQAYLAQCLVLQGKPVDPKFLEEILAEASAQSGLILALCQNRIAWIYIQAGKTSKAGVTPYWDQAESILTQSLSTLEEMGYDPFLSYGYSVLAGLYFLKGEQRLAGEYSQKSLEITARNKYVQDYFAFYDSFHPILKYGLENDVETTFIQRVLIKAGAKALNLLTELAVHPDPQVRFRAIFPLSQIKEAQSVSLLHSLTKDSAPEVQTEAKRLVKTISHGSDSEEGNPLLKIWLLGPLRIFCGKTEITSINWRTGKARDLLVYLAHQGGPVSAERIFADLWLETPIEKINDIFHTTMYRLRQTLNKICQKEFIQYGGKRYQLLPDSFTTDLQQFQRLLAPGLKGDRPLEHTIALQFEQAITLYRGDYLADLDYPWIIPHQEHLKRLYLEANLRLARFYLQNQEYARAITNLGKLTDLNPLSEEIHCLVMNAYAGLGDRLAVSKQYQKLVNILDEELGLEPTPETRSLYYKLCGTEGALATS